MTEDPVRRYLDALKKVQQARAKVERVVGVVTDAGKKLGKWQEVSVSDVNVGFPAELLGGPSISGREWPTAQELAEALAAWHNARHEARNAWSGVPGPDRSGLQSPP